jgi:hypothetical protein
METPTEHTDSPSRPRQTRDHWHSHYQAWKQSGLKKAAYCRQAQIDEKSFYNWSSKFQKSAEPATPEFNDAFVPVQLTSSMPIAKLQLQVADVVLSIHGSPSAHEISEWMRGIRNAL